MHARKLGSPEEGKVRGKPLLTGTEIRPEKPDWWLRTPANAVIEI
jgi:hypothetical protein